MKPFFQATIVEHWHSTRRCVPLDEALVAGARQKARRARANWEAGLSLTPWHSAFLRVSTLSFVKVFLVFSILFIRPQKG